MFRMNWHDFKNHQIKYKGTIYPLLDHAKISRNTRTRILFLLNIYRGVFVTCDDIIDFVYDDMDVDEWPDYQLSCIRKTILRLRVRLPAGVRITNSYSFGYKLEVKGEG